MHKVLFVLLFFVSAIHSLDQSPIASFACQLCSSGNALALQIIPEGYTCTDLDIALRNLGKSGCFGLDGALDDGSVDPTNITQVFNYALELEERNNALENRNTWLLLACIGLGIALVATIAGCAFVLFWREKRTKEMESVNAFAGSKLPVYNHTGLLLVDPKEQ